LRSRRYYHINAVDEVTRREVAGATEQISESFCSGSA